MGTLITYNGRKIRNTKMCYIHIIMGLQQTRDSFSQIKHTIINKYKPSETKINHRILHVTNDVPFKYLGVHISPNGYQNKQSDVTLTTIKGCAWVLASKPFTHFQSRLYLNTHLNPKLHFHSQLPVYLNHNISKQTKPIFPEYYPLLVLIEPDPENPGSDATHMVDFT